MSDHPLICPKCVGSLALVTLVMIRFADALRCALVIGAFAAAYALACKLIALFRRVLRMLGVQP